MYPIYTQHITFHITDDVALQQEIWEKENGHDMCPSRVYPLL